MAKRAIAVIAVLSSICRFYSNIHTAMLINMTRLAKLFSLKFERSANDSVMKLLILLGLVLPGKLPSFHLLFNSEVHWQICEIAERLA